MSTPRTVKYRRDLMAALGSVLTAAGEPVCTTCDHVGMVHKGFWQCANEQCSQYGEVLREASREEQDNTDAQP